MLNILQNYYFLQLDLTGISVTDRQTLTVTNCKELSIRCETMCELSNANYQKQRIFFTVRNEDTVCMASGPWRYLSLFSMIIIKLHIFVLGIWLNFEKRVYRIWRKTKMTVMQQLLFLLYFPLGLKNQKVIATYSKHQ